MKMKNIILFITILGLFINDVAGNKAKSVLEKDQTGGLIDKRAYRIPYKPCYGMFCKQNLKKVQAYEAKSDKQNSEALNEEAQPGIFKKLYHKVTENKVSQGRYRPCIWKICSRPLKNAQTNGSESYFLDLVKFFIHNLMKTDSSKMSDYYKSCVGKKCSNIPRFIG